MKNFLKNSLVLFCIFLSLFYSSKVQSQQTLTTINGWNAYVHLPASYNSNSNTYPTIIFFPGIGEIGYDPAALISNGPGAYISQGWNGNVQVDGSTVEFIVISVQPPSGFPAEYFLNEKIETIKSQYRVDLKRLYLTGLSMGGWCSTTYVTGDPYGGPYTYASKIAAVVTVEGMRPDDNSPYPQLFDNYANVGGRYVGFEQALDGRDTKTVVDRMNATRPGSAIHVLTNFGGGGHCCWNQFYGGQGVQPGIFLLDGVNQNMYQWMARQSLGGAVSLPPPPPPPLVVVNQPPTVNAGADITITLPANATTLNGLASDPDGTIASYQWTLVSGPGQVIILSPKTASTIVNNLVQGVYQFELTVTDNGGAFSRDNVNVTVLPATVTLLPAVNPANTVTGLDYKYYEGSWNVIPAFNNLTPVKTGTVSNFDISVANKADLFGFTFTGYINLPADGEYTFFTTSDDGSMLYIDDVLTVNNDGLHAAVEKSGSIGLKAGKHAITGMFFEQTGGEVFTVSYSGMGIAKQVVPAASLYRVNTATAITLLPAVNPANTVNGLDYKYYEGSWSSLPNFSSLTPVKTGNNSNFDISLAGRTSQFGFSFTGYIDVPADGQYTFHTISDDGSMLYIDNILIVNNDGLHAAIERSGTVGLKAGKHAITGLYFEQAGNHDFTVSYEGMGISKQQIPSSALYRVSVAPPPPTPVSTLLPAVYPANTVIGLDYKYYEGAWTNMPNFAALNPVKTGTTYNFSISVANAADYFGISFTGYISVPADGEYTFYTTSDDGSMIYIDGVLVVNNDGIHSPQERSGTIGLQAGKHRITALYFDYVGNNMFYVGYEGMGITKQLVPWSVLYRDAVSSFTSTNTNSTSANAVTDVVPAVKATTSGVIANAANVYPNPFTSAVKVQLNDQPASVYTLTLVDINGKRLLQKKVTKGSGPVVETISASHLAPGTYILQIINENGLKTSHKLIKK